MAFIGVENTQYYKHHYILGAKVMLVILLPKKKKPNKSKLLYLTLRRSMLLEYLTLIFEPRKKILGRLK